MQPRRHPPALITQQQLPTWLLLLLLLLLPMPPHMLPSSCSVQLPAEVREARRDELISLQQRVGEEWAKTHVGQEVRRGRRGGGWGQ